MRITTNRSRLRRWCISGSQVEQTGAGDITLAIALQRPTVDDQACGDVEVRGHALREQVDASGAREGVLLVILCFALGAPGVVAAARLVSTLLNGMSPLTPAALVPTILLLFVSALLASLVPAWKAVRPRPARALLED